jgi:hypothetical protein
MNIAPNPTASFFFCVLCLGAAPFALSCSGEEGDPAEDPGPEPEPGCVTDADCGGDTPLCDVPTGVCNALPLGYQIGYRDGAPTSALLVPIHDPGGELREATDLDFHPTRTNELWVSMREFESASPCTQANTAGCASLEGKVLIITNPGQPNGSVEVTMDPNAWHFMRRPPAIAMGAADTWGTCGEFRTGNMTDDPTDYMGPALFSSDRSIWTHQPPGKNGSHLDMLHETPLCMGIGWERDNVYWVANGQIGSIDRYDFATPHEVGGEDHSNGMLARYAIGALSRVPGIPGHVVFHEGLVYAADTGHGRIVALDPTTGTMVGLPAPIFEPLALAEQYDGSTLTEVVPPGLLVQPSGLHIHGGVIFVTDSATSTFHAFDLEGNHLRSLATTLPAGSLAGLTIGPDDKVYFVDRLTSFVYRLDPI